MSGLFSTYSVAQPLAKPANRGEDESPVLVDTSSGGPNSVPATVVCERVTPEIDLHFHELRGTAATRFYTAGRSERVTAEIMGWEDHGRRWAPSLPLPRGRTERTKVYIVGSEPAILPWPSAGTIRGCKTRNAASSNNPNIETPAPTSKNAGRNDSTT